MHKNFSHLNPILIISANRPYKKARINLKLVPSLTSQETPELIEFNLKISKKIPSDRILKKQIELINLKTCKHLKYFVETTLFIQAKDLVSLFEQNFGYSASYPNILYALKN